MNACAVPRETALNLWPEIEPLLKRATDRDRGRSTPETLKALIAENKAHLWVCDDLSMAMITTVEKYPTGKLACLVRALGGSGLSHCLDKIDQVVEYARALGCDFIEIQGREGWLKVLPGFEKDATIMTRELH